MNSQVLTDEEIKSAKRLYQEGVTLKELGQKFDAAQATISTWIKEIGGEINSENKALKPSEESEVINLYKSGLSSPEVAKRFPISGTTVRRILEREDISRREYTEANRVYDINQEVFQEKTPASSYWIGFLLADGCIYKTNGNQGDELILKLQASDIKHLQKFNNFLETNKPIYKKEGPFGLEYSVRIRSQQIVNDLEYFGVKEKKSLTANPHHIDNKDFWRGVIDGDGCLSVPPSNRLFLILYGAKQVCKKFERFVKNFCETQASTHPKDNIYRFTITGKYACKMTEVLYKDSEMYLDRKYKLAKQFF